MTERERSIRIAYDEVADDYAALLAGFLDAQPIDRAVLGAFAEFVLAGGGGPVADVGCGSGRLTGHLHDLGLDVVGVDLSPQMLAVARSAHPRHRFEQASMSRLPLSDGSLAGIVAWYSVIHTPPEDHPEIYSEFARALRPGGQLVVAFQVGDEHVHLEHAYGHDLSLDVYRLSPERVAGQLEAAGLFVTSRLVREPVDPEVQQQAYLLATKLA